VWHTKPLIQLKGCSLGQRERGAPPTPMATPFLCSQYDDDWGWDLGVGMETDRIRMESDPDITFTTF
jgi:hypothetical protein